MSGDSEDGAFEVMNTRGNNCGANNGASTMITPNTSVKKSRPDAIAAIRLQDIYSMVYRLYRS